MVTGVGKHDAWDVYMNLCRVTAARVGKKHTNWAGVDLSIFVIILLSTNSM